MANWVYDLGLHGGVADVHPSTRIVTFAFVGKTTVAGRTAKATQREYFFRTQDARGGVPEEDPKYHR